MKSPASANNLCWAKKAGKTGAERGSVCTRAQNYQQLQSALRVRREYPLMAGAAAARGDAAAAHCWMTTAMCRQSLAQGSSSLW